MTSSSGRMALAEGAHSSPVPYWCQDTSVPPPLLPQKALRLAMGKGIIKRKQIKGQYYDQQANNHQEIWPRTLLRSNLFLKINHELECKPPTWKRPCNLSKAGVSIFSSLPPNVCVIWTGDKDMDKEGLFSPGLGQCDRTQTDEQASDKLCSWLVKFHTTAAVVW